jgi:hypothetical protein
VVGGWVTDMRKGFDGLAALLQQHLGQDPFTAALEQQAAELTVNSLPTVTPFSRPIVTPLLTAGSIIYHNALSEITLD